MNNKIEELKNEALQVFKQKDEKNRTTILNNASDIEKECFNKLQEITKDSISRGLPIFTMCTLGNNLYWNPFIFDYRAETLGESAAKSEKIINAFHYLLVNYILPQQMAFLYGTDKMKNKKIEIRIVDAN